MGGPSDAVASTPDATASVAQSKDRAADSLRPRKRARENAVGQGFAISPYLARHVVVRPYQRRPADPVYRPLRIFALDPAVSKLQGAVALLNVAYEPLRPGPRGRLFHVRAGAKDPICDRAIARAKDPICNLEDRQVLMQQGFAPSRSDPRFQQQMVYAVCSSVYASFKAALGRDPVWGFERDEEDEGIGRGALILRPQAFEGRNAYYDKAEGALNFGHFTAEATAGGFMQGEKIFTCLSHDVIAHELTHALLDGLRSHFTIPTQVDVLAFHEAFADLVAVFQHFSYREVVLAAIQKSRGEVTESLLTDLARPLGVSTDRASPLRRAVDAPNKDRLRYDPKLEVHELGSVLVLAVFDAFNTIYRRKTARYLRLATHGTGHLALGELPADLQAVLAQEASQLASQFLSICIRAVDYCPPVDLEFGEFLRAVITADRELVPDDPWGYREAWIDAFRDRGIRPAGVTGLDEAALAWKASEVPLKRIHPLSFARLRFQGDPGHPAGASELSRQATALGEAIVDPAQTKAFGLLPSSAGTDAPCIESIRSARRVGPDRQILFDIVAEISQRYVVKDAGKDRALVFYTGSTVILGPQGEIRYVIGKGAGSKARMEESQRAFMLGDRGNAYWEERKHVLEPRTDLLQLLHGPRRPPPTP